MPPRFENGVLDYVDLDIDLLVWKDFSFEILDREEFENNSVAYAYSDNVRAMANNSLRELKGLIERREFPFDYSDPKR
jgi:protein associated with RNAse G/E